MGPTTGRLRTGAATALVGRDGERGRLGLVLDRVASGQGQVLVLAGDPGIGKTCLARDLIDAAGRAGFTVLEAQAHVLGRDVAFGVVQQLLAPLVDALDDTGRERLGARLPDLARLFPTLDARRVEPLRDAGLERARLAAAVSTLLRATGGPIVLFVDDVQWIDDASLAWLAEESRALDDRPLLVLATLRTGEPVEAAVDEWLAASRRLGLLAEMLVAPLAADAVHELVHARLGDRVPPSLLAMLDARAAGVPLFVEMLLEGLVAGDHLTPTTVGWVLRDDDAYDVPPVVRDIVLRRLDRLDPVERAAVELVATAGRGLRRSALASVVDGEAIAAAAGALARRGLLEERGQAGDVVYGAAHPLVAEVAYAQLTMGERERWHRVLADALDAGRRRGDRRIGVRDVARHLAGAGATADAARLEDERQVLLAAGDDALSMGAAREAARCFDAAADRAWATDQPLEAGRLRAAAGTARLRDADGAGAVEVLADARALVDAAPVGHDDDDARRLLVARIEVLRAEAAYGCGDLAAAGDHLREAARLADARLPAIEGELLPIDLQLCERTGDLAGLIRVAERAAARARHGGGAVAGSFAATAAMSVAYAEGDLAAAWSAARRARELAAAAGDVVLEARACEALVVLATDLPDIRTIRASVEPVLQFAERLGLAASQMRAHASLGIAAFNEADLDDAEVHLAEALAIARRTEIPRGLARVQALRALVLACRGRTDEADACIAESHAQPVVAEDDHVRLMVVVVDGLLAIEARDPARGLAIASELSEPGALLARRLTILAELHVLAGAPVEAERVADELLAAGPDEPARQAMAGRVRGLARAAAGDPAGAIEALRGAAARFGALGARWEGAQAEVALAVLERDTDRLVELLARYDRIGAAPRADAVRSALRDLGVRAPAPTRRRAEQVLSDRELEVARLAAQGLTNAQIADRLFISRHTAGNHLRRVYAQLDVSSRSALTRRMIECSLL